MKLSPRRSLMVALLAPVVACGGSHGGSPTTPTSASAAGKCRTYPTSHTITQTVPGLMGITYVTTESYACTFDRAARVLQCAVTVNGGTGCTTFAQSTTYATAADFVEEAEAPGRERFDTFEVMYSGNCTTRNTHTYTYDAQKRPVRRHSEYSYDGGSGANTRTYTAWETLGRPTQETWTANGVAACNGVSSAGTATTRYDDAARSVTWRGTGCSSGENVETRTYDADGNLVNDALVSGDFSYTRATAIRATARVCL